MGRGLSASARIGRWIDRGLEWQHGAHPAGRVFAERRYLRTIRALQGGEDDEVLARAWMNLGNVRAVGAKAEMALEAYDRAIALLQQVRGERPDEESNLLGAAWLNRGVLLLRLALDSSHSTALASFDSAIEILSPLAPAGSPFVRRNLGAAWMNRSAALGLIGDPASCAAAARALEVIAPLERDNATAAEIGLKARLLWLGAHGGDGEDPASILRLLRGGLALPARDQTNLRSLFVFGADYCRRSAPEFLALFLLDSLAPGAPLAVDFLAHLTALESATAARQEHQLRLLTGQPEAGAAACAARLRELAHVVDRLQALADSNWPDAAESVWLRARAHELAGRPAAARTEWLRHFHRHPAEARALAAAESWPEHRGTGPAAARFAGQ